MRKQWIPGTPSNCTFECMPGNKATSNTHDGLQYMYLYSRAMGMEARKWRSMGIPNCSITAFTIYNEGEPFHFMGSYSHMDEVELHFP